MKTSKARETPVECLPLVEWATLLEIPGEQAAKVARRIVDNESIAPRLEVAAFNSAH